MASAAAAAEPKDPESLVVQPLLEKDPRFIVREGILLRTMLVDWFWSYMDEVVPSNGMTRCQMLDLILSENASSEERAIMAVGGSLASDPAHDHLKRLKYLGEMSLDGTWGDEIMLMAFAELFQQPVFVYQIDHKDSASRVPSFFFFRRHHTPKLFKVTEFGTSYTNEPMHVLFHGSHYSTLIPSTEIGEGSEATADSDIMLNKHFFLLNVPGDGNCLFTSLRLAMEIKQARIQISERPDLFDPSSYRRIVGKHVL
jgi:hypothetical protein